MSGYSTNIPQANQTIASTTSPIQTNFNVANTAFAVDHVALTALTNQGFHNKVTLIQQSVNPNPSGPLANLYTKAAPTTSNTSDLYYQNGSLASNVVQLTGGGITAAAWLGFVGSSGAVSNSVNASLVRNSIGNYTVTFSRPFVNTNYLPDVTIQSPSGNGLFTTNFNFLAGSFNFQTKSAAGTNVDCLTGACVFFGNLT